MEWWRLLARNKKAMEKAEKALTEVTCMMGKLVDAFTQFKNMIQEIANEDRKREERWFDIERKREERTREREAERRLVDQRREAEKREREGLRQLIKDEVGAKNSKKEETENKNGKRNKEEKGDVEDKEKKPVMKSVLERSYTENSMKYYSKKKSN